MVSKLQRIAYGPDGFNGSVIPSASAVAIEIHSRRQAEQQLRIDAMNVARHSYGECAMDTVQGVHVLSEFATFVFRTENRNT